MTMTTMTTNTNEGDTAYRIVTSHGQLDVKADEYRLSGSDDDQKDVYLYADEVSDPVACVSGRAFISIFEADRGDFDSDY